MRFSGFGLLILIAQVVFGVHAYRRGKYLWIVAIIFLPLLGTLLYLFAEFLPSMRMENRLQTAGTQVANTLQPGRRLAQLEESLSEHDTIVTRQAYAEELMRHERLEEAISVLESGLKGVFANDSQTLFLLAQAYAKKQDYVQALAFLEIIQEDNPSFESDKVRLLRARMLEAQGREEEAITEYRELAQRHLSEEPRYYLALALDKQGAQEEATSVYQQALKFFDRSSRIYRQENQVWIRQLKQYFEAK